MQIDPIIPIIVAIIGTLQIVISLYAGRKQTRAVTEKESAIATKEIGETYATLIDVLEKRLGKLEIDYKGIQSEYDEFREKCRGFQDKYDELKDDYRELSLLFDEMLQSKENLEEQVQEISNHVEGSNSI